MSALMKALPIIVSALGKKHGINVVIRSDINTAMTNGSTICLPVLPPEAIDYIRGFIDHESAHIRYTDFSVRFQSGLWQSLLNIIEDVRIEKLLGEKYPGCKINLRVLEEVFVRDGLYSDLTDQSHPAEILVGRIHHGLRVDILDNACTKELSENAKALFAKAFTGAMVDEVEQLLLKVPDLESTREAADLVDEIIAAIQAELPEEEEEQGDSDEESSSDQSQGSPSDSDSGSSGGSPQSGDSDDDSNSSASKSEDDAEGSTDDEGDSDGTSSSDQSQGDQSDSDSESTGESSKSDGSDEGGKSSSKSQDDSEGAPGKDGSNSSSEDSDDASGDVNGSNAESGSESGDDQSDASDNGGSSSGSGQDKQSGDQSEDSEGNQNDSQQGGKQGSQSSGGDRDTSTNPAKSEDNADEKRRNQRKLIESMDDEVVPNTDVGDKVAEILKQFHVQGLQAGIPAMTMPQEAKLNLNFLPIRAEAVSRETTALRVRLTGLLQAEKRTRSQPKRVGTRINTRSLHKVAVNDSRIFTSRDHKRGLNTGIVLLLDQSSSMANIKVSATEAAMAIALAAKGLQGVKLCVAGFTSLQDHNAGLWVPAVIPMKSFAQRLDSACFVPGSVGGTPLADALWWASAQLLHERSIDRRVVITVTDGRPDCARSTKDIVRRMTEGGIENYAVGIQHLIDPAIIPNSCYIGDVSELPARVFSMIKDVLVA